MDQEAQFNHVQNNNDIPALQKRIKRLEKELDEMRRQLSQQEQANREDQHKTRSDLALERSRRQIEVNRLRAVLDLLPVGIFISDASGKLLEANEAALKIWGDTPLYENITDYSHYKGWWPVSGERLKAEDWALARSLVQGETVLNEEVIIEAFDGTRKTILNSSMPVRDESGAIINGVVCELDITERKQMEDTLRRNEERYRNTLMRAPAYIFLVSGPEHIFTFVNRLGETLFRRELLGRPIFEAVPELKEQGFQEIIDNIYLTGEAFTGSEVRVMLDRQDNGEPEESYFNFVYQPVYADGPESSIEGILIHAVEVTPQVRARQEVEAQRRRLYELMMDAPATILFFRGPELRVEFANRQARQRFPRRNLDNRPVHEVFPDYKEQGYVDQLRRVYQTGQVISGTEVPVLIKEPGEAEPVEKYLSYLYQPTLDAAGQVDGVLLHSVDVTSQVKARRQVEQLVERIKEQAVELETILEAIPDAVFVADRKMRLYKANSTGKVMLGLRDENQQEDGILRPRINLFFPDGRPVPLEQEPLYRALEGEVITEFRLRMVKIDNNEAIEIRVSAAPIRADGEIKAAVAVVNDVTLLHQLEQEKEAFLSVAAHELRTPITSIKGMTQLAMRKLNRGGFVHEANMLQQVEKQANRLTGLVNDLTDVNRIQTGKLTLKLSEIDLVDLTRQVVESMQATTDLHSIRLSGLDSLVLQGDADRLEQVLSNLINNSIKYSPEGGTISVGIKKSHSDRGLEAVISVEDEGMGVSPEDRTRLFERFQRGSKTEEMGSSGFGLGLYISREIVDRHGGRIWLEERKDRHKGACFCLALPL
ncbi:MAG TPA: PAS domain-containing protein [Chloroflexia bacterium]|nr:PAS domain-containing protein [Chloroflexia bacterium]